MDVDFLQEMDTQQWEQRMRAGELEMQQREQRMQQRELEMQQRELEMQQREQRMHQRELEMEQEVQRLVDHKTNEIRYEVFMEQRLYMKKCIQHPCRLTNFNFVPPDSSDPRYKY